MKALGSRRGGLVTLVLVAAALVAAATFLIFQFVERPAMAELTPVPDSAVNSASPDIAFAIDGNQRLADLTVTIDGEDVTHRARATDGKVTVTPARLDDGPHAVDVSFTSSNLFARSVDRRWEFQVDTKAPPLTVSAPAAGSTSARKMVRFTGTSEPRTKVVIAVESREATATAGPKGGWTKLVRLPEGKHQVTISATDRAGNTTVRNRTAKVDTTAPTMNVSAPAKGEALTTTDEPLVYGAIPTDNPRALTFSAAVNGKVVVTAKGSSALDAAAVETGYTEVGAGEDAPLQVDGHKFALAVGALPQGRNRVTVVAADAAGNTARVTRIVKVDTTEQFGAYEMVAGASGADVTQLQERLLEAGVYPKKAGTTATFDTTTVASVKRYQKKHDLPLTGRVDARTRKAMVGRIIVTLHDRSLRLVRDGKVVKKYGIAIGQPAHPTPTGDYEVIDMQVDPAWFPPDSPWAAGLGVVPPGPGNPLGTRWIGTSAPAIGIHGTYADSSIGTAASHGCMRMHIPDVEELYDQVSMGMPVSIRP